MGTDVHDSTRRTAGQILLSRFPRHPVSDRMERLHTRWTDVGDGRLRSFRMSAHGHARGLPVLFVPGWGGMIGGFTETLKAVDPQVELIYVETREKRSSCVERRASFSMGRVARDIGAIAADHGLRDGEFVLVGSSFGAAAALQVLADKRLRPATTVLYDPMPRLWIPRWLLSTAGRLLPAWLIGHLRPGLKRIVLGGMREPTQRRRTERFIDDAVLWKWRAAALSMRHWQLWDVAPLVDEAVNVVNGSTDRFHAGEIYPEVARAIPRGRLFRIPVSEAEREHLIGAIISAFALEPPLPEIVKPFQESLNSASG